jgi:anti-sigma B factor antagonist
MTLDFYEKGNAGILEIKGRLDAFNAPDLKNVFEQMISKNCNVVFDLKGCEFVDSTGLGMIVACLKSASQAGGDIRLANVLEKPRMVFEITRAYKIFQFFESVEAAIQSYE